MSNTCFHKSEVDFHNIGSHNFIEYEVESFVYILANKFNGTIYTGVTSNLEKRVWEHKNDLTEGFTKKYSIHNLVYYEIHSNIFDAISREKQIKKWNRQWKLELISRENPGWIDLWEALSG